jgi:glycosyltransferase involved in cell wall biosynthesis
MLKALEGTVCSVTLVGQRTTALQALVAEVSVPVTHLSGLTPTEMAAVYQESDILLYASTYEGFGMPIVEAQACGCLVVTSDQEPMRSVAGFDSAVLVNPESVSDIREGVHSLIKSPELRAHLREQGYRNSALYEPSAIAKQLIEIYNEVF